jgi:hypothetical protein
MMDYLKLDRKTILLFGSGRSGTSWLSNLLASPFRYRLLFEPFHTGHVPCAELVADRYYEPGQVPEHVVDFIFRALNDEIDNEWIAQSSYRKFRMHRWRFWPKVNIVKEVRGALLIPSIRALFGPSLPILVLVRHPGAVVESFMRVKFPWGFDVKMLLAQARFQEKYDVPLDQLADYATDPVGQLAVRWVIENGYLLQQAKTLGVDLIFYEDLVQDRATSVRSLFMRYGLREPSRLDERVRQLSTTTHRRSPWQIGDGLSSWRQRMSASDVEQLETVLKVAGVSYPK